LSSGWALGQVTWAKMAKNLPHLWHHSKKNETTKFFFSLQTQRLAESFWGFEQLSSTISYRAMWLVRQPKYACFWPNFQIRYIRMLAVNVLKF